MYSSAFTQHTLLRLPLRSSSTVSSEIVVRQARFQSTARTKWTMPLKYVIIVNINHNYLISIRLHLYTDIPAYSGCELQPKLYKYFLLSQNRKECRIFYGEECSHTRGIISTALTFNNMLLLLILTFEEKKEKKKKKEGGKNTYMLISVAFSYSCTQSSCKSSCVCFLCPTFCLSGNNETSTLLSNGWMSATVAPEEDSRQAQD